MKLTINANSIYDRVIRIGRQTENLVSEITFNLNMWIEEYGLGECVLNVRRNGDGSAYPVPMTITGGMTTWTITDTDTSRKGRGEIQLVYRAGEKVKTSPIFTISCGESLVGGEVPEPYEEWLSELNRMTAEVESAKTSASASAQTAQTAAGTATEKATEAEQSATTASGFANNASASATSASTSAQAASQSAQVASVARTAAEAAAVSAQAEAEDAEAAKTAAEQAETNAHASAQTASAKASEAAESVTDARTEADRAKTYADRAAEVELEIPTKVSELENDAGYLTEHQSLADYVRKDVLYNMLPTNSASGAVASFTDGADDIPLKSLVVSINPVQDLHGYDKPWPAGGGKNLFDKDSIANNKILTWQNGSLANENGSWVSDFIPIENDTTYFNNYAMSQLLVYDDDKNGLYSWRSGEWKALGITGTVKEKGIFVTPSNGKYLRFSCRKVDGITENLNVFQLEKGSAETDYTPYTNICPISGWTGAKVEKTGVNIWDEEWEVGGIDGTTGNNINNTDRIRSKNYIPVHHGTGYYFCYPNNIAAWFFICEYDAEKVFIKRSSTKKNTVFTASENCYYIRFFIYSSTAITIYNNDISINYPATDTDYHPYSGETLDIIFPAEAGTVYGGTLDVLTGVLTATKGFIQSYNGEALPSAWISDRDTYAEGATPTTGAKVCYDLAEPVTYQLTPTEVKSLLGQNNIFADTGGTAVTYRADIQRYIDKRLSQ